MIYCTDGKRCPLNCQGERRCYERDDVALKEKYNELKKAAQKVIDTPGGNSELFLAIREMEKVLGDER